MDLIKSQSRAFAERNFLQEALLYVDDGASEATHVNLGLKGLAGDDRFFWHAKQEILEGEL